jgi:hypothetical protein
MAVKIATDRDATGLIVVLLLILMGVSGLLFIYVAGP